MTGARTSKAQQQLAQRVSETLLAPRRPHRDKRWQAQTLQRDSNSMMAISYHVQLTLTRTLNLTMGMAPETNQR